MGVFIKLSEINKKYGDFDKGFEALKNIDLEIQEGEFLGVMGPSGSGKSTLINIIATLDSPTKGSVCINDTLTTQMNNDDISKFRKDNVGLIFQNYSLLETLTNRDNISAPLILANKSRKEIIKRVEELAKKLDIVDLLDKYPAECSGGQKQRVSIARALSNKPKIIIADEPTAALDAMKSMEIVGLLKKLNIEEGITVVMVTHDQLVGSYSDRVILVANGEIDGEIKRDYKNGEEQVEFYKRVVKDTSKEIEELFGVQVI